MKITPRQRTMENEMTMTGKFKGLKVKKVVIVTTDFDETGTVVPKYDGSESWYSVQVYTNTGMPIKRREFGGDQDKAITYFVDPRRL